MSEQRAARPTGALALLDGHQRRDRGPRRRQRSSAALSHELATEHGARLADLFADEQPDGEIVLRTVYALDAESRYLLLECAVQGDHFPQLSDLDPAAFIEECEIYEQYGIRPDNGKPLNRVLMPPHRADAFPRLRRREGLRLARDYQPHVVSGEAFEFPFGPVRVAGWESLYMGLVTTGEEVLDLYLFHWHKHRGVERRLTGLDPARATFFVERADGLSSVGDTLAFCRAVEAITGDEIPAAAAHTRTVALELERIYNHAAAIAAMCQTTGLSVGQARAEIVLEQLLRCNLAAFGHRYLFGVAVPGGVRRASRRRSDPQPAAGDPRRVPLRRAGAAGDQLARRPARGHGERLSSRRPAPVASRTGRSSLGPADRRPPRSSLRRRRRARRREVCTRDTGDVLARMNVMVEEVDEAARLIDAHLGDAGDGLTPLQRRVTEPPSAGRSRRGARRSRGCRSTPEGAIRRARIRPASVRNWRAFDDAARAQNVFTDIPIIEASFWLTVAGFAR